MIRRSPTRLELKLEDLQEYDYVHKGERKNKPAAGGDTKTGNEEARKLLRQERIGYMNPSMMVGGTAIGTIATRGHMRRAAAAAATAAAEAAIPSTTAVSSTGGNVAATGTGPAVGLANTVVEPPATAVQVPPAQNPFSVPPAAASQPDEDVPMDMAPGEGEGDTEGTNMSIDPDPQDADPW